MARLGGEQRLRGVLEQRCDEAEQRGEAVASELAAARGETKKVTNLRSVINAVKFSAPARVKSADKENEDEGMLAPSRGNSHEPPVSPVR